MRRPITATLGRLYAQERFLSRDTVKQKPLFASAKMQSKTHECDALSKPLYRHFASTILYQISQHESQPAK